MHPIRAVAPLALVAAAALAACTGTGSPSADPSAAAPSGEATTAPSGAPSGAATVEVVATDYAFSDVGDELTGPVTFTMRNDGAELHELVIVRKNDGVTTSFEELLARYPDYALASEPGWVHSRWARAHGTIEVELGRRALAQATAH